MNILNKLIIFGLIIFIISCNKTNKEHDILPNSEENIIIEEQLTNNSIININTDNYYFFAPVPSGYYYPTAFNKHILGERGISHLESNIHLEDLLNLTKEGLGILRNAIYARHGYIFSSTYLSDYFSQFPWYNANFSNVDIFLTEIDQNNILLIQMVENNYSENYSEFIGNYGDLRPGIPHGLSNEGPNRLRIFPNGIFAAIWSRPFGWDWENDDIRAVESYSEWKKDDYNFESVYYGLWNFNNNILKFGEKIIEVGRGQGVIWDNEKGVISSDNIEHIFIDNMWYFYSSEYNSFRLNIST